MNHPCEALVSLIQENQRKNMRVAEVGVYDGITSKEYLPIIKENGGMLYLVDWFKGQEGSIPGGLHGWQPEREESNFEALVNTLNVLGYSECTAVLKGLSHEMAILIPDESLDICFIDADHTFTGVKRDITAYLPKVKKGGILCGHDAKHPELMGTFSDVEKELQWYPEKECHPGVLSAIYELFILNGKNISFREDKGPINIPIWIYNNI